VKDNNDQPVGEAARASPTAFRLASANRISG